MKTTIANNSQQNIILSNLTTMEQAFGEQNEGNIYSLLDTINKVQQI